MGWMKEYYAIWEIHEGRCGACLKLPVAATGGTGTSCDCGTFAFRCQACSKPMSEDGQFCQACHAEVHGSWPKK